MTRILLTGLMATGKSSVGAALAQRTGWPYLDNDVLLERTAGASAADLLEHCGEDALRAAESRVLTLVLGMPGPLIAGVAAGVVLDPVQRQRLKVEPHVVWLRAEVSTIVRRIGGKGGSRPLLGDDPAPVLTRMSAERSELYAEVADHVIDVDVLPTGQVARRILEAVGRPA